MIAPPSIIEISREVLLYANANTNVFVDVTFGFWRGEGRLRNRERRNVKIIPGPDRHNKQPMGLARVAFEVDAHRSRSEGFLPRAGNVT